jgi:lipopolysaccharide transport system permease protein
VFLGLVPWQLTANIVSGSARSLTDQRNLVTKVYFAREALPFAVILSALVDFAVAMLVVGGLMAWYGIAPGAGLLLAPVVLATQLVLGAGLALVLSASNLLYRDTQYILQVGLQVWMFASSVVYPIPRTGNLKWLAWLNPMTPILDAWRACFTSPGLALAPEFGLAALISLAILCIGWRWFRRVERVFGELA